MRAIVECLKKQIAILDKQIAGVIKETPRFRAKAELLRSAPGVGRSLGATIIARLPELGTESRRKVAALVGVAPFNRDSGKMKGKRTIWGGRGDVRAALYLGTMTAIRLNPMMRGFYDRLRSAGKSPKMALTACMRKLIVMLNAMLRSGDRWSEERSLLRLETTPIST
jgi:transposase